MKNTSAAINATFIRRALSSCLFLLPTFITCSCSLENFAKPAGCAAKYDSVVFSDDLSVPYGCFCASAIVAKARYITKLIDEGKVDRDGEVASKILTDLEAELEILEATAISGQIPDLFGGPNITPAASQQNLMVCLRNIEESQAILNGTSMYIDHDFDLKTRLNEFINHMKILESDPSDELAEGNHPWTHKLSRP